MKELRFETELLETVNNITGSTRYYIKDCSGEFSRISKKEYEDRTDQCFGISCLYNTTSKKYNRFYKTVTNYITVAR
ncbi:hypothetical protein NVP1170O_101 [Vibrio phage 1.170.O._10N.261.52.C3]|nr:hypothetical protein NVP1170O_101 [Vibrio phage 1.170.O._10N.261.52.C3]